MYKCPICFNENKSRICKVCGFDQARFLDTNIITSHLSQEDISLYQEAIQTHRELFLSNQLLLKELSEMKNTIDQLKKTQIIVNNGNNTLGATLSFGNEESEWIILTENTDAYLILSKYCLNNLQYHENFKSISWNDCDLNQYLNNVYFEEGFTENQKEAIIETFIENGSNKISKIGDQLLVKSKIFLLSIDEAIAYFHTSNNYDETVIDANIKNIIKFSNQYTISSMIHETAACEWILRSPGQSKQTVAFFNRDGNLNYRGQHVTKPMGIRPALWVKKDYFKEA